MELTGAADAGVLTTAGGEPAGCEATAEPARELLELELRAGSGPVLDCIRDGEPVGPVTVSGPVPWAHIAAAARAAGYTTVQACPMRGGPAHPEDPIGALVLYTRAPLDAARRHIVQALADATAVTIVTARTLSEQAARVGQLQFALDSRVLIEQAKGVLAERHRTTPDEAFARLRARARTNNEKIHAVAAAVVATTRGE